MDKRNNIKGKLESVAAATGIGILALIGSIYGLHIINGDVAADKVDYESSNVSNISDYSSQYTTIDSMPYAMTESLEYSQGTTMTRDVVEPVSSANATSSDTPSSLPNSSSPDNIVDTQAIISEVTTASVVDNYTELEPVVTTSVSEVKEPDSTNISKQEITSITSSEAQASNVPAYDPKTTLNVSSSTNTRGGKHERDKITIINGDGFQISPEVEKSIVDLFKNNKRKMTFYVSNPETGFNMSFNCDDDMAPASSIKAGICLAAVKMIDRGELNWTDEYTYQPKHQVGGSGIIQNEKFGKKYTVEELIHLCTNISDNVAYYMLLMDVVGRDRYNDMVSDLGVDNTLGRSQTFGVIDSQELNLIWQEIYAYGSATENGAKLLQEFKDAKYSYLKTAGYKNSAHKSGWNSKGYVDSGIIYGDKGTYIITIMTTPSGSTNSDSLNFTKAVNYINKAMDEYYNYMDNKKEQDANNSTNKTISEEALQAEKETGIIYPDSPNYKPMPAELRELIDSIINNNYQNSNYSNNNIDTTTGTNLTNTNATMSTTHKICTEKLSNEPELSD